MFREIERASSRPVVLLVGEAGWGKTAFAGFLFGKDPGGQLLAAHFCRADRADTSDLRRFSQSIAAMIALRLPAYNNRLPLLLSDNIDSKNDTELFEFLILSPLSALDPKTLGKLPRYLLVDGLDEAVANDGTQGLHKLLARTTEQFPEWLKLVATTRNAFSILEAFPAATTIRLDDNDPRNRVDIDRLIEQKLAPKYRDEAGSNLDKSLLRPSLARGISAKAAATRWSLRNWQPRCIVAASMQRRSMRCRPALPHCIEPFWSGASTRAAPIGVWRANFWRWSSPPRTPCP